MTDLIDTAKERKKLSGLTGHTPGPWFAGRDYEDGPFVAGGGYCRINTVGPELDREPNARLIAAAPDLLATVHRLLDALDAKDAEIERLRRNCEHLYRTVETVVEAGADLLTRAQKAEAERDDWKRTAREAMAQGLWPSSAHPERVGHHCGLCHP